MVLGDDEHYLPSGLFKDGEIVVKGCSVSCPPLVFACQVAKTFPSVDLDLHGETKSEWYEHWKSADARGEHTIICVEERLTNLQAEQDAIIYLRLDGQEFWSVPVSDEEPFDEEPFDVAAFDARYGGNANTNEFARSTGPARSVLSVRNCTRPTNARR